MTQSDNFLQALKSLRPEPSPDPFAQLLMRLLDIPPFIRLLSGEQVIEGYRQLLMIVAEYPETEIATFVHVFEILQSRLQAIVADTHNSHERGRLLTDFQSVSGQDLFATLNIHQLQDRVARERSRVIQA